MNVWWWIKRERVAVTAGVITAIVSLGVMWATRNASVGEHAGSITQGPAVEGIPPQGTDPAVAQAVGPTPTRQAVAAASAAAMETRAQRYDALVEGGASITQQRLALVRILAGMGISAATIKAELQHAKPAIALEPTTGRHRSRVGGRGLLPPGVRWPQNLAGQDLQFLAAVDLADMPKLAPLPKSGTLLFYWSWRFDDGKMDFIDATRVLWVPTGTELREQPSRPPPQQDPYTFDAELTPVRGVMKVVPGDLDAMLARAPESENDRLLDFDWKFHPGNFLLGAPSDFQSPALAEAQYNLVHESYPQTLKRFTAAEQKHTDWSLLMGFDGTDDLSFGDGGQLYFVVPTADLKAHRFDRVMGIMQSH